MPDASDVRYTENRHRRHPGTGRTDTQFFSPAAARTVRSFHGSLRAYHPTPLRALPGLAGSMGVSRLWVKDESRRCGLDAFKVLGASYAVGRYLARELGVDVQSLRFDLLGSPEARRRLGERIFVTATDGNHGRAVAWAVRALGHRAVVFLPHGASPARVASIRELGAEARVTEHNYDESVRLAAQAAERHGWVLLQDTAWSGYEQVPFWVMQGYLTMFAEAAEQLEGDRPTHVFIQAGVGSLAASLRAYLHELYGAAGPYFAVVEPKRAACFYGSAGRSDGSPGTVAGALDTIMAGLAAGKPSTLAWPLLRDYSNGFFACTDAVAAEGMRLLAHPLARDPAVVSGESGAVTTGLLARLCHDSMLHDLRQRIDLGEHAKVLLFSTEGATDPTMYAKIVSV